MVTTVDEAFKEFLKESVNLDPEETKKARNSKGWLVGNIEKFDEKIEGFPHLYNQMNIEYGSFSRRTKKKPLDDIDLMIALGGQHGYYQDHGDRIEIYMPDTAVGLSSLREENNRLNSRKVINAFISALEGIENYKKADIKRNQEAATLNLTTYTWIYDIVPCFYTTPESNGRTYYLIPDGKGNWKKTDPRIDRDRCERINLKHKGIVLPVIRTMKFWNGRPTMPKISSYLLECMILNYYDNAVVRENYYVDLEVKYLLYYLSQNVGNPVYDPKEIEGNINLLNSEDVEKIKNRASLDYQKAIEAGNFESAGNHEDAIEKWGQVFGDDFPVYSTV